MIRTDSNDISKERELPETGPSGHFVTPGSPFTMCSETWVWLQQEKWWTTLCLRSRRVLALKIVGERVTMFNEVRKWRKGRQTARTSPVKLADMNAPAYCNKCGLCCEVASGMPDFPAPEELPAGWREVFANGLGQGHRFCPFLWEDNGSGGGFCSIYPLRSNPCRLFGFEECDFFWKSSEPVELSSTRKILLIGRWLVKLVNARKLPLASTQITAKRPKLLEFNRI